MKHLQKYLLIIVFALANLTLSNMVSAQVDYVLDTIPDVHDPLPENSVQLGDSKTFEEVKLDLPVSTGPFEPTWESIEANYPGTPDWLREAKFGIWIHFGPQAAGESGDWYARRLYSQGSTAYNNHLSNYGHPSEVGYKEVLRDWNPDQLDPAALVDIYKNAGVKYLIIQGVHHDQFDMWDSKYQPWNSTNMGPNRDLVGEWVAAAKNAGMRFGITFHHEYSWWWWQTAFQSDATGAKAGVPYDGNLTLADGVGQWWEGMDPRYLYGVNLREYEGVASAANSSWSPPPAGIFSNHLEFDEWYAKWWALRMMDAVDKYNPDFIYTDGTDQQPFSGYGTGTGYKSDAMQRVIADFYNKTLDRRGEVDVFSIVKFRNKTNGTVNTEEGSIPGNIKTDQAWIAETPVGDWFYAPNFTYSSNAVIRYLLEQVARDGNVGLCVSPLSDGSLDAGSTTMLTQIGEWLTINGEGIYGSHAWEVLGEGAGGNLNVLPGGKIGSAQANHTFYSTDFRFTVGKNDSLYAWCMKVPLANEELTITSLGTSNGLFSAPISSVELLGYGGALTWSQDADGLHITCPATMNYKTAVGFKIGPSIYNYTSLSQLITKAQAEVTVAEQNIGFNTGQYIQDSINILKDAIVVAQSIGSASNDSIIKAGILTLKKAMDSFNEYGQIKGGIMSFDSTQNITRAALLEARNFERSDDGVFGTGRWGLLANPWKYTNNIVNQEGNSRGGFDNYNNSRSVGIQKWFSSDPAIENGMIYQTTTLPAGSYKLKIKVHEQYGLQTGEIYMNVAAGDVLPLTTDVPTKALAYYDMKNSSTGGQVSACEFTLSEETEVSIGWTATIAAAAATRSMRVNEILLLDGSDNDISSTYLGNYTNIQRKDVSYYRFGTPKNWTVENFYCQTSSEGLRNGIDKWSGYNSLMMGFWGDVANAVGDPSNAKLYKEVTLPAGKYAFTAAYDANYNLSKMYLFVSDSVPELSNLEETALAFYPVSGAPTNGEHYGLTFTLDEESTIYLGWIGDLTTSPNLEFRATEVRLLRILSDTSDYLNEWAFDAKVVDKLYIIGSSEFDSLANLSWFVTADNIRYIEGNTNGSFVIGDINFSNSSYRKFFVKTALEGTVPVNSKYDFYKDDETTPFVSVLPLSTPSSLFFGVSESDSVEIDGIHKITVKYNNHASNIESMGILTEAISGCYSIIEVDQTESICEGESIIVGEQTFTESGKHTISLKTQLGCDSIVNLDLTVNPIPMVSIGNDTTILQNQEISLDAGEGYESYNWSSGEKDQVILLSGLTAGEYEYSVTVTNKNECSNSDTIIISVNIPDAINNVFENRNISIYPNPTNDVVYIKSDEDINSELTISIFDDSGTLLVNKTFESILAIQGYKIDLSMLNEGIYLLKLNNSENIKIQKVIKE